MFKVSGINTKIYQMSPQFVKNILASIYSYRSNKYKYSNIFKEWRIFLNESQYYSNDKLKEYQRDKLKELLLFCEANSFFYKNIFEEYGLNLNSDDIFKELTKIPILDKEEVRNNYKDIKTNVKTLNKLIFSSSGTTGTSLHVPITEEALEREYAFKWQYQSVMDAKFRDKFAYFTGHNVKSVKDDKSPFHLLNYNEKSIMFSIYHLSKKNIKHYVDAFNKFAPKFITGYPSGFYTFVSLAKEEGLNIKPVKAIFSASEVLHDYQKELVENYLNAHIFEWYGQVELTVNIHECEKRKMHVKEEYGYLELIKNDGTNVKPGEFGNAIGTGFGNKALPLIRYNTGDVMKLSIEQFCECGRGGRIIEEILGRDEDTIITPSGKIIGRLDFIFKPVDTVKESQIIQEDINNIKILVVALESYTKKDETLIIEKAKERLGDEMIIRVEKIDKIPRNKSGKIRYVVSKVKFQ